MKDRSAATAGHRLGTRSPFSVERTWSARLRSQWTVRALTPRRHASFDPDLRFHPPLLLDRYSASVAPVTSSTNRVCGAPRKEERLVPIRPADQVVFLARLAPHLEDPPSPRRDTDLGAVDDELITHLCVHRLLPSCRDHPSPAPSLPRAQGPSSELEPENVHTPVTVRARTSAARRRVLVPPRHRDARRGPATRCLLPSRNAVGGSPRGLKICARRSSICSWRGVRSASTVTDPASATSTWSRQGSPNPARPRERGARQASG